MFEHSLLVVRNFATVWYHIEICKINLLYKEFNKNEKKYVMKS
jgi:hypothetical protein